MAMYYLGSDNSDALLKKNLLDGLFKIIFAGENFK